jgi:flagellar motility protein MotE (MotC chaperone)
MMERMKEQLGADDAAWKVLEPRLTKVMDLNRQTQGMGGRGGMFGMMGGMRGQRGGNDAGGQGTRRGPQQDPATMTPIEKAQEQLRTTLENQSASPEEIKKQLTALREAREKAKQELAVSQQELRKILTLRQEAQLVIMGQLP